MPPTRSLPAGLPSRLIALKQLQRLTLTRPTSQLASEVQQGFYRVMQCYLRHKYRSLPK